MTEEELEQLRQLIREELRSLNTVHKADARRFTRIEETAQKLLGISQNLVTLAQSHEERLDRLAAIIERYVTGRGANGTGG